MSDSYEFATHSLKLTMNTETAWCVNPAAGAHPRQVGRHRRARPGPGVSPYRNCPALRRDHPNGVPRGHCAYHSLAWIATTPAGPANGEQMAFALGATPEVRPELPLVRLTP